MKKKIIFIILILIVLFVSFYLFFLSAPFKKETNFLKIESGTSLRSLSLSLKEKKIIRSRFIFESLVVLFDGEKRLPDGYFSFEKRECVIKVARRIVKRNRQITPIRITLPEGYTVAEMADVFANNLPNFNKENFLAMATDKEGYLFPDTYFFFFPADENEVLNTLEDNFKKQINSIKEDIDKSNKKLDDIIIMASLVEGEANGDADRALISGILWARLEKNMRLQVDVAPITYKEAGLPEKPISNPGMKSILASIYPEKSPYLFYLHEKSGQIHYAKDFAGHRRNIEKYLK